MPGPVLIDISPVKRECLVGEKVFELQDRDLMIQFVVRRVFEGGSSFFLTQAVSSYRHTVVVSSRATLI
jgi:hypothetical protein